MINLFSKFVPSGNMILLPSLATMMHVPARRTPLPNHTSPETVKWSSSIMLGMDLKRFSKFYRVSARYSNPWIADRAGVGEVRSEAQLTATFLKWSPSLTTGVPPNSLDLSIVKTPCSRLYSLDLIRSKSLRDGVS